MKHYATLGPIGSPRAMSAEPPTSPPDYDDDIASLRWLIDDTIALLGRADRALIDGDKVVGVDLMLEAGRDLANLTDAAGNAFPAHPQAEQLAERAAKADARRFAETPEAITGFAEMQP